MELIPHCPVLLRSSRKPPHPASLLHWIKRRKVAEFHRETVWRAPHFLRRLNDDGIPLMQFPEWQFAVEIQRDEEMLARPFHCGCFSHDRQAAKAQFDSQQENACVIRRTWPGVFAEL